MIEHFGMATAVVIYLINALSFIGSNAAEREKGMVEI